MNKKVIFVLLTIFHLETFAMLRNKNTSNSNTGFITEKIKKLIQNANFNFLLQNKTINLHDMHSKYDVRIEKITVAELLNDYYSKPRNGKIYYNSVYLKNNIQCYQPITNGANQSDFGKKQFFKKLETDVEINSEIEVISVIHHNASIGDNYYCDISAKSLNHTPKHSSSNPIMRPSYLFGGLLLFGSGLCGFLLGRYTSLQPQNAAF